ncbi:protein-glutamine gamma-glutamyltransferase K [Biomphalaria glabrata]|nr:protein-glutamine gamma-glutamyltransferase K-like [Biomphalaria glabrata]
MTRAGGRTRPSSSHSTTLRPEKHRYFTRSRLKRAVIFNDQDGRINLTSDEEHRHKTELLKPLDRGKALKVTHVNVQKEENGLRHHTFDYQVDNLVVRRGWPFTMSFDFDRDVDVNNDRITLQLAYGSRPQFTKGTLLRLDVHLKNKSKPSLGSNKFAATVYKVSGRHLSLTATTPPDAFVGPYALFLETRRRGDKSSKRRQKLKTGEVYILFNTWCEDDVVYVKDEEERREYVMNEHGRIWRGSALSNEGTPWYYGQFDRPVLEAAIFLMDSADVKYSARRWPIAFVRTLSAMTNSNDDDGVLVGRWTKTYPKGCTLPTDWTGSVKILNQFMSENKPVEFGQCWVFAGVITSLLRALGIPTRCVTNFSSAHDRDSSMTIDNHFDENNQPIKWMNDSVWNYHVWNESYFKRPDLPEGYDGWQAHDATPQEVSEGVMRCGPAPVKAVKLGHVYLNYDVPFVFSEVNGDKVMWKVSEDGDMEVVDIDTHAVGKYISTKAVGSNLRHDLTLEYKYPDGSKEEADVLKLVHQYSSRADNDIYNKPNEDVEFRIAMTPPIVGFGEKIMIEIHALNKSKVKCKIKGRVTLTSCYYTGVLDKDIKSLPFYETMLPKSEHSFRFDVSPHEYLNKLNLDACVMVNAIFNVEGTKQNFARSFSFSLLKPNLIIKVPKDIKVNEETSGSVQFTNSVGINLTSATIHLEGPCISSTREISKPIKPGESVKIHFKICPRRTGYCEINAKLTSDQLTDIDGSASFQIFKS